MKEKKKVPKLRFPEFSDDWELRKFGDISDKLCVGFVGTCEKYYTDKSSGIPMYRTGNIKDGVLVEDDMKYVTREFHDDNKKSQLKKNDIVIARFGDNGLGALYLKEEEANCLNCIILHVDNKMSPEYVKHYLSSDIFRKETLANIVGSTFSILNTTTLSKMNIPYTTIAEQTIIGEFLTSLDKTITLHQHKCDEYKELKKGMLQKMFPKEGEKVPEIRFPGFTDDWVQRGFKSITFPSGVKNKENLPYESYSVTNENGFIPQNEQFENGGTMATADKTLYYIVTPNSFAYNPARINVGSIGYYEGCENVIVSSLYEVFKTTDDVDDKFLWHWFKSVNFQRMIEKYQEGGVRLYFYYDKLCMCSIPIPNIQEQRKVGAYLDKLDNLITLHQRKCEEYKILKKAMLQQMFV